MKRRKIIISGTGCALADYLYRGISFDSPGFRKYLSLNRGDGGLTPGKLVFTEELERFSGKTYDQILKEISVKSSPDVFNVGGPSLVSLIHASQMLDPEYFEVRFYGMACNDETSGKILNIVKNTPLNIENYLINGLKATPFTDVFSDPSYAGGHGERTFVNSIGAAWEYSPEYLYNSFFDSQIACFGGTALVPQIHDNLTDLLGRAKNNNCITLVNTVFDFRNEKNNPGTNWPLVNRTADYALIDVLIMDSEEAMKISGQNNTDQAADFFISAKVPCFIITDGANDLYAMSNGSLFKKTGLIRMPVSSRVKSDLKAFPELKGDTTGCGDNFAGGIIFSLASQLKCRQKGCLDLTEALVWGTVSGGFACYIVGGTFHENFPGEKFERVTELHDEYIKQINI